MKRGPFFLSILAGLVVLFISIAGFINMRSRAGILGFRSRPLETRKVDRRAIRSIDGQPVTRTEDIDYLLSRKRIGDPVVYQVLIPEGVEFSPPSEKSAPPWQVKPSTPADARAPDAGKPARAPGDSGETVPYGSARPTGLGGRLVTVETRLVPYYVISPGIFLAIGGFAFFMGFLVFSLRSGDPSARIFYWLTLVFGSAVIINGDIYGLKGPILPYVPGLLFNFSYPLAPALLMRFARTFSPRRVKSLFRFILVAAVAAVLGAVLNYGFLYSQLRPSYAAYQTMQRWFPILRWFVILTCLASVFEMIRAFRATDSEVVRAQIKWVFYGLLVGLVPFLFLYELPRAIGLTHVLSEDFTTAFFIIIPVAIAIAILRYRLMNINLVINRSLVYSLLTVFTVGVYLVSIEVLRGLFVRTLHASPTEVSLGAAVLAAALFEPGRKRIQVLVDKTFFRQAYDYGKGVLAFNGEARKAVQPGALLERFQDAVDRFLPLESLGVIVCETDAAGRRCTHFLGLDDLTARMLMSVDPPEGGGVLAREEAVLTTDGLDFSRPSLLENIGVEVLAPIPFGRPDLDGYLALGRKRSGRRFTREDLDYIATVAGDLAAGLSRIRLQEEIAYERASREKVDELSQLKTEFISSVSHELRTPMTSLQSLSELLRSGKVTDEKRRGRMLELMAGECGRLSRFLHNVLDFGRIERGAKTYTLRSEAVQPVIQAVVDMARPDLDPDELRIRTEMAEEPVMLDMDADAVRQALFNLVDNAIKYSPGRKDVTIRLLDGPDTIEIEVEDRGIGIDAADREKVFDAFFRSPEAVAHDPKGVGLGLKIVKHIMDGHGGRIGLRSEPGKGSVFRLIFPKGGPR